MFQASKLFNEDGGLFSANRQDIAKEILRTDAIANSSDHETKLARLEIGLAIREVAKLDRVGLTETISNLELCKDYDRSENSFLKWCRICGQPDLLKLANDQTVTLTVLDELASSKKPIDPIQRKEFVKRLCVEVQAKAEENRKDEGLPDDPVSRLRVKGATRSQTIGMIRRAQIEFKVPTRAVTPGGNKKDRGAVKNKKNLARIARLVRMTNCAQILLLPDEQRDKWLEREKLEWADVAKSYASVRESLINDGIIKPDSVELLAHNLIPSASLMKSERDAEDETEEPEEQEKDTAA